MSYSTLLASGVLAMIVPDPAPPPNDGDIVISMSPCKAKRSQVSLYVNSSKKLVFKGELDLNGERFDIFLPFNKKGVYSAVPRPERKSLWSSPMTSTYLSVDQDHDGKITELENYYAEFPLRLGDAMFDVVTIDPSGSSITLRPSESKLSGPALGRLAADFEFKATDGRTLRRGDFEGKILVIDCWAPT